MEQWLDEYPGEIELVIANNDDMALGAIDAMGRAGVTAGTIQFVGIDGTPAGLEAIRNGTLLGTVESDRRAYAEAIFETARQLVMGEEVTREKYSWSPQQIVKN